MSGDKAVLMLIDRLTDVLLLRSNTQFLDNANSSHASAVERMHERIADKEAKKKAYYVLLAAWEKNKSGLEPKKPAWLQADEAQERSNQNMVRPHPPGKPGPNQKR